MTIGAPGANLSNNLGIYGSVALRSHAVEKAPGDIVTVGAAVGVNAPFATSWTYRLTVEAFGTAARNSQVQTLPNGVTPWSLDMNAPLALGLYTVQVKLEAANGSGGWTVLAAGIHADAIRVIDPTIATPRFSMADWVHVSQGGQDGVITAARWETTRDPPPHWVYTVTHWNVQAGNSKGVFTLRDTPACPRLVTVGFGAPIPGMNLRVGDYVWLNGTFPGVLIREDSTRYVTAAFERDQMAFETWLSPVALPSWLARITCNAPF